MPMVAPIYNCRRTHSGRRRRRKPPLNAPKCTGFRPYRSCALNIVRGCDRGLVCSRASRSPSLSPPAREAIPQLSCILRSMQVLPSGPDVNSKPKLFQSFNGAFMACAGTILVWWDRDFDTGGRPIRSDVRSAARELWQQACHETKVSLADDGPAAELMENAVAEASRYLDRIGAPLSSRKHGLVMIVFCRALRRYRARSSRLELVGASTDFSDLAIANGWLAQADARLGWNYTQSDLARGESGRETL